MHPLLVAVHKGRGAGSPHGGVVRSRRSPVYMCALHLAQRQESGAHATAEPVDEDALALFDIRSAERKSVRGAPVEDKCNGLLEVEALGHGNQVFLGLVDQLGLAVVDTETGDESADCVFFAAGPVLRHASDEGVAGGQGRFLLHRIDALAHEDVGAAHARVEDFDLDFAFGWGGDGGRDDRDDRVVAVARDDDFAHGYGHCGGFQW